jgi:hypothetical protein
LTWPSLTQISTNGQEKRLIKSGIFSSLEAR